MSQDLKIGLIGLDTSHAVAFTKLLNKKGEAHHIAGAQVVAAYPGGTPDWELSWARVDGFTAQLGNEFGVAILDSPEAVAEQSDIIFITAVDGRAHRELFERIAPHGKPVFIDKPFTASTADAQAILDAAVRHNVPVMSCSSLRYADALTAALADDAQGAIQAVDVFGPMALEDALPGLFWYGCHGIEMVVTVMGAGCREVRAVREEHGEVFTLRWADGRTATYRGLRAAHHQFGAVIHREKGFQVVDIASAPRPFYASMLEAILCSLPKGESDVPPAEMLEVVRVMEAGNAARRSGEAVELEPLAVA